MRNKTNIIYSTMLCVVTVVIAASCNDRQEVAAVEPLSDADEGHAHKETAFKPGKGIQLSELGRVSVGLETSEVKARAQGVGKLYSVQIYRRADEADVPSQFVRQGYAYASVIIPAAEAKKLKPGQKDGESTLVQIDWQLEHVTGQAEAIVEIHDPEARLAIGNFIKIRMMTENDGMLDVVTIPESAVLKTAKGDFAYAANQEYFFRIPIQVAGSVEGQVVITDGLFEGDVIASGGVLQLYQIELQAVNGGQGCAHGH